MFLVEKDLKCKRVEKVENFNRFWNSKEEFCATEELGFREDKAIYLSEIDFTTLNALNQIKVRRESKTLWSASLKVCELFLRPSNCFVFNRIVSFYRYYWK